eukprot:gene15505-20926_t
MSQAYEYILSTRPWSFTAAIVPIIITTAVTNSSFLSESFIRALSMGIFIQAGANLTNTYFDYINGVDSKDSIGDRTLIDKKIKNPFNLLIFSCICYLLGIMSVYPYLVLNYDHQFVAVFIIGVVLAFFYTGKPVGLKYLALGDITIFICFGPLLMQATSLMLTGNTSDSLHIYTVPIGCLTEGILHANNARDIKHDTAVGAVTLASILGYEGSLAFFILLLIVSYCSALYIAAFQHYGVLLCLLTIPLSLGLVKNFANHKVNNLCEETAQMHLPFGVLMLMGILLTSHGFAA